MTKDELRQIIALVADEGVVRVADLRDLGATSKDVEAARRRGDLTNVVRGIDVVGADPPEGDLRARVALVHAGPGAVLSGLWAARELGWRWVPVSAVVQALVPGDRRRRASQSWVRLRRCNRLTGAPAQWLRGLPVADNAQIVVDACRHLTSLRDVRGVVLGALLDRRTTLEEIRAVMGRGQVAGTALLRRACLDAERGAVSPPEAEFCDAMIGQGVAFYLNCELWVHGVFVGKPDGYVVGTGVGWECDSQEEHAEDDKLQHTLDRDKRWVRTFGLSLEHRTPRRFRQDPSAFVSDVLAEVERRRRLGLKEPDGLEIRPCGPLLH